MKNLLSPFYAYIFVSNSKGVMSSMTSSFLVSFMIASIFFFFFLLGEYECMLLTLAFGEAEFMS